MSALLVGFCLFVCLFCLFVYLFVVYFCFICCLFVVLFLCPSSLCPCVFVSLCPCVFVSLCICVPVSLCPCVFLLVCLCVCLLVVLCVPLSLCPFVFVSLCLCIPVSQNDQFPKKWPFQAFRKRPKCITGIDFSASNYQGGPNDGLDENQIDHIFKSIFPKSKSRLEEKN